MLHSKKYLYGMPVTQCPNELTLTSGKKILLNSFLSLKFSAEIRNISYDFLKIIF
jgi:hypothetical protein